MRSEPSATATASVNVPPVSTATMVDTFPRLFGLPAPMLIPDRPALLRRARDGRLVPVRRGILFDTDTAVGAYAKLARPPFGFRRESVEGGETWARYTFLGTEP